MVLKNFRLFPVSEAQKRWGIYLTDCGREVMEPEFDVYPPENTPAEHRFSWEQGRIQSDFYLVYLVQGKGYFENRFSGLKHLSAGMVFLSFPGVWNRHKPDVKTGWETYAVGFQGRVAAETMRAFFPPEKPVIRLRHPAEFETLLKGFIDGFVISPVENPLSTGGRILELLGLLLELRERHESGMRHHAAVRKVQGMILRRAFETIDFRVLAREVGMSESTFRRSFQKVARCSPLQFQHELRLREAMNLLGKTDLPVAEIGRRTGFEQPHYFTRLFTEKTDLSPREWRRRQRLAGETA